jgi:NAD+ synthase
MIEKRRFSPDCLRVDPAGEVEAICSRLREVLKNNLRRRGFVLGLSGGIDSSVTAALVVRAVGADRVLGLEMPERHSAEESLRLSSLLARHYGIETCREDITPVLEALRFYRRYEDAVRRVVPEYGQGWKSKIVSSNPIQTGGYNFFSIVVETPEGQRMKRRLPLQAYLEIVAATNFKQRTRKMLEYYHADRCHYAVAGTPNRLEYDQGFFVKQGDGAADVKPIAHLYKSQVYQLAEYLDVPEIIRRRPPTTDTYSLSQGQDEFYFSLPYREMDLCLYAKNNGIQASEVAPFVGLDAAQVEGVFRDIEIKRSTTRYQHQPPFLVRPVPQIDVCMGHG